MSNANKHTLRIHVHESEHNWIRGQCDSGADVAVISLTGWMALDTEHHEDYFDNFGPAGPLLVECDQCGTYLAVIKFLARGRPSNRPDLVEGQLNATLFPLGSPEYATVEDNMKMVYQHLPLDDN